MKKLTTFDDDAKFYRGTIIVLKGVHISLAGTFDIRFGMINESFDSMFKMVDLYRSIGACIWLGLKPNVQDHFAVDKHGIKEWVTLYFNSFYTKEDKEKWIPIIDDILYIEDLKDYFE